MIDKITEGIKTWLVHVFASAVTKTTRAEDRVAAIQWLGHSRDVVASDLGPFEKFKKLNSLMSSKTTALAIARNVSEAVANYKSSNLPWSMKIALPATLAAIPLVGGQAAGIAAFGSAIGVPVLLLIFLGAAGITSVIESVIKSPDSRTDIERVVEVIISDERMRRASAGLKAAMRDEPMQARRFDVPVEERALRQHLHDMDPFYFEQHTLSFFTAAGLKATGTRKSNDMGVDGFVIHPDGLVVLQCKRNAAHNKVGSPTIQQFKGVVEEQNAVRGYIITTSLFTDEAKQSAKLSDKIVLIDMDQLIFWHGDAPTFA